MYWLNSGDMINLRGRLVYEELQIVQCKCVIVHNMLSHVHNLSDGYTATHSLLRRSSSFWDIK